MSNPVLILVLLAQTPPTDRTRAMELNIFGPAPVGRPAPKPAPAPRPSAVAAPTPIPPPPDSRSSFVGMTVWRLQEPKVGRTATRSISHDGTTGREVELERLVPGDKLPPDQRVRFGVESSTQAYLYVFDQERLADGSLTDPVLVFPTQRLRGGDNLLRPHFLVEFPDVDDRPNFLRLDAPKPNVAAEVITVLVSPRMLPELSIRSGPYTVDRAVFDGWRQQWTVASPLKTLTQTAGTGYSQPEKAAARRQGGTALSATAPMPLSLYPGPAGQPVLWSIEFPYSR